MSIETIKFDEKGFVPAIVQDANTKEVLTLAYMNKSHWRNRWKQGNWFFSRSRQELWHKGETSGNTQTITEIKLDCDRDALSFSSFQKDQPVIQARSVVLRKVF